MTILSPFRWRERTEPSIFASDINFIGKSNGKTVSQIASKAVDDQRRKGKMSGTIPGLGVGDYDRYREHQAATRPQNLVAVHPNGSKNSGGHRTAAKAEPHRRG